MARLRLFLYGTLQPAARTTMARWIEQRLVSSTDAAAAGRIFAVNDAGGWFPAFVRARSPALVRGTLCELDLRAGELALLDRYEGVEYRRLAVPIRTGGGSRGTAQLYLWRVALPRGTRPIRSGDFLEWLRDNRLSAFRRPHDGA